jgi:hypothetical protein
MKNANGHQLSGYSYVRAKMRCDPPIRTSWFPLVIRSEKRCTHGGQPVSWCEDVATICTKCAEWWSWDYDLTFERTAGGRTLAGKLGLDPLTAGDTLRYKDGYEKRPVDNAATTC